ISIRIALGAKRSQLIRQLFIESLLVAVIGAVFGVIMSTWAGHILLGLVSAGPSPLPLRLSLDLNVLSFTALATTLTAVLFGFVPAFRITQVSSSADLKERRGSSQIVSRNRLARGFLVGQVAISLTLLTGAGLFLRTLLNLTSLETGFQKE